jgi:tRNA(Leu) C34 or U34 (ribose-2'-O)-methylase TrmL
MRSYQDVTLINHLDPLRALLEANPRATPVAVELRPNSEMLPDFEHPSDAPANPNGFLPTTDPIYVFGPEDGSLPGHVLKRCHRFVVIPSFQCLNLATSVATVLYDRMSKMPIEQRPVVQDRGVSSVRGDLATSSHY